MKKIFLLTTVLISMNLYSQEKEIKYFNYKWKPTTENNAKFRREIVKQNDTLFTVNDFHKNGKLYMKGQYSSIYPLIENGFFEFYDFDNYKKIATGFYTKGLMTGDWEFIDYNGINRKVSYDLNPIFYKTLSDDITDSTFVVQVEEMPKFQGSKNMQVFANYIGQNLIFPPMAQRYVIEDKVLIQFTINKTGQVRDIDVKNNVDKDLEREAIRVVSQAPYWTPGYQEGKAVRVQFTLPINFKLK